ncbi:hypothetical protein L0F63_006597 [Massospora cicadina]|nr:hypothetical protein L0F63_006597 [Massospora cicadina]
MASRDLQLEDARLQNGAARSLVGSQPFLLFPKLTFLSLSLLRFFRLSALLFLFCAAYGIPVKLCIRLFGTPPPESNELRFPDWYTLSATHLFSILSYYLFEREFKTFRRLRWVSLKAKGSLITSRTVWIFNIPPHLRGPALEAHITNLNLGEIEQVNFHYYSPNLDRYIQHRTNALFKVERNVHAWVRGARHPCDMEAIRHSIEIGSHLELEGVARPTTRLGWLGLFGPKVDAINYFYKLFLSYNHEVEKLRNSFETFDRTDVAFLTFKSIRSSSFLSQIQVGSIPPDFDVDLAPEPLDIYWKNMNISLVGRWSRRLAALIALIFVMFFGVLFISALSKGLSLTELNNALFFKWQRAIEKRTISLHFWFLIFNILLVLTLISSFWNNLLYQVLKEKQEIIFIFADAMKGSLSFFIRYFTLLGVGCFPLQLLHPGPLFYYLLCYSFCSSPRGSGNLSAPVYMDYGWLYGAPMFVFVVVSIYSSFSPLILVVGVVYFTVGYFVVKNNLLYVYTRLYESNGLLWPFVYRHIVWGIFLLQLFVMASFVSKHKSGYASLVAPLFSLSVWHYVRLAKTFRKDCRYLPADWFYDEVVEMGQPITSTSIYTVGRFGWVVKSVTKFITSIKSLLLPPDLDAPIFSAPDPSVAEPNLRACHHQSPSLILKGILDSSLSSYRCPSVFGKLPHLWVSTSEGEADPYLRQVPSYSCCAPNLTSISFDPGCELTNFDSLSPTTDSSSATISI